MKTRKKITKTPTKGRRSSIICLKKSPIVRKNLQRNVKNSINDIQAAAYDSPLKHLYKKGSVKFINSKNLLKNTELKINIDNANKKKESKNTKNSSAISNFLVDEKTEKITDKIKNQENNKNIIPTETDSLANGKKRSICNTIALDDVPYSKRIKMFRNPLSRLNNKETNNFSDSIILIDDTQFHYETQTFFNDSKTNSLLCQSANSLENNNIKNDKYTSLVNSEEIVVIDSNESSFSQNNDYPSTWNKNENLPTTSTQLTDSIIVIDPDDESPAQTRSATPKSNDDCFVVWSSLPRDCKSNNSPNVSSPINTNSKLSEKNKFIIHTQPDYSNLRILNNENNNSLNKKSKKLPQIKKGFKKPLLKSPLVKKKFGGKLTTEIKTKSTNNTPKKSALKLKKNNSAAKVVLKTNITKFRKKAKNNGELIFLSESREENEITEKTKKNNKGKLREIVIDGSNCAMAYTKNKTFSEKGIKMLIDYFTKKGHVVKVFVPQHKRSKKYPLLEKWHSEGIVIFTPSRTLGNKSFTPYDDRYILEYATTCNGIVVSQDQFRDLYAEKPQYRDTIENRLLVPTFVGDYVMFPEDPLGRRGPTLANFLKH